MGKQPYIPLYIGDWEQDTNCLSLEAEGACLKIVFKCWKNKGIFMTNVDSLCRLLKVDHQKFATILLELKTNNIFDLHEREDGCMLFTSRRIVRDIEISSKRAVSGSKGGSKSQAKRVAKPKQNLDIDNDNEIESIIEIGVKTEKWVGVKTKYAGEKPKRIYDLAAYFAATDQLPAMRVNKWDRKFEAFMDFNPSNVFDDEEHLYNSLRRYCTVGPPAKSVNGTVQKNIDDL